jgi:C4-type Zn-finger protein
MDSENLKPEVTDMITAQLLREEFIEAENNCPLCGTELMLNHETDFAENQIHETAHCPACNLTTRQKDFNLQ